MITITRKIQLNIVASDKEDLKQKYDTLYGWQRICHRAANWVATHLYIQEGIKNLFYLTDETKVKLGDIKKDPDGILTTSRMNTTYQLLSKNFKGDCPMGMLSGLNTIVSKTYRDEAGDVHKGIKSLRVYKRDVPMPVRRGDISNIILEEDGKNYSFSVYGMRFKTWFGRDLGGNAAIFERAVKGAYKWCDSSIAFRKNKLVLYAVLQFEKQAVQLDKEKICYAELDINYPVKTTIGNKEFTIGNADEFLHRRVAIQAALRKVQADSRFSSKRDGRKLKMQAIDRFAGKENNYVDTKIHIYTFKLVDLCVKNKCGTLVLRNQVQKEEEAKEDKEFLLRNWSYFGMKEKIAYKCAKWGIELIVE